MPDTTTTTVEASIDAPVESSTVPALETPEDAPDAPRGNKEARYRVERNAAREEAEALAQRVAQLQTRELERIASKSLANPADLLTLAGVSLKDLLDDNGDVDPGKVHEVAAGVLASRPGLRPQAYAVDYSQGHTGATGRPAASFSDLLK